MPEIVVQLPPLYAKQKAAIFDPARIAVIEGSTKSGKTVGSLAWQFSQAFGAGAGKSHIWVAPIYPQAQIAFSRSARYLSQADPHKSIWDLNKSEQRILFANGSSWVFKGSDNPDGIYGGDYASAVIDEASRCTKDAWYAVRSTTTATRGPIRIIGNVKGRKNWAYELGVKARKGEPNLAYHKITALDAVEAGVLAAEEVESAKRELPDHVFRELYLCEPTEDGSNPFGLDDIAGCVHELSPGPAIAFGVDLAKSIDYTVVVGVDRDCRVCYFDRWHGLAWDTTEARIVKAVGTTPTFCDSSGIGDPIVERLRRYCPNVEGIPTGTKKQMLMEGLAVAIQQKRVGFPLGPIKEELDLFEYSLTRTGKVSYSAPSGAHDDCVIGLALAVALHDKAASRLPVASWASRIAEPAAKIDFASKRRDEDWGWD